MPSTIDSTADLTTTELYLFPVHPPRPLLLYQIILGARLPSAGSAVLRLALYRITNARLLQKRPRTGLGARLNFALVSEFGVTYAAFDEANSLYVSYTDVSNTTGFRRVSGTLERSFMIDPSQLFAIGVAAIGATVRVGAPTSLVDQPGFRCDSQNPGGDATFPRSPSATFSARTPSLELVDAIGMASLGG